MGYKILCMTPIGRKIRERLEAIGELIYEPYADDITVSTWAKHVDIIFMNPNKMKFYITYEMLKDSKVKYLVTASTGVNHIDPVGISNEVELISLTTAYDVIEQITSTAEHAFGLTLALIRNIPKAFTGVKDWDFEPYIGMQLKGKTVGIIGYGRLGKMYANYAQAFGCKVLYYDIKGSPNTLEEVAAESDIISLHVHLNSSSYHMIDCEFFSKVKNRPYLINTARGSVVNEYAVLAALQDQIISGYATDVLADELKDVKNSPILQNMSKYNIIVTPHIGGMTHEGRDIAYNGVIDLLLKRLNEKASH
jgi:D-3-phosphoglycerate dehydrogenase